MPSKQKEKKFDPFRIFRARRPEDETKALDTTPMEMPIGFNQPRPLQDLIASMVRDAVAAEKSEEFETPDEADDFEVDDDDLLDFSPYELTELIDEMPMEKPHVKLTSEEVADTPEEPSPEVTDPPEERPAIEKGE